MLENYQIRSLEQVETISKRLGEYFTRPQDVTLGLRELLLNAFEHGNLNIGFEQKGQFLRNNTWQDEVKLRLTLPPLANRSVTLATYIQNDHILFRIQDEGSGFDWRPYLNFDPERQHEPHGRGIALANHFCFDSLTYHGAGNCVDGMIHQRYLRKQYMTMLEKKIAL